MSKKIYKLRIFEEGKENKAVGIGISESVLEEEIQKGSFILKALKEGYEENNN